MWCIMKFDVSLLANSTNKVVINLNVKGTWGRFREPLMQEEIVDICITLLLNLAA